HSRGGASYVVEGLAHPLVIVGDSLFASSMGGGMESYEDARSNNLEKILRLPPATVVACGHGPLTTVGEELVHNPFFAS
ncbi:MAG TPA: MBL fold metallo-hydrolase, partial [Opitutaceae bacterium]|nr:MBL fold metallo-hydrolase [Opitutaceae bacterium]